MAKQKNTEIQVNHKGKIAEILQNIGQKYLEVNSNINIVYVTITGLVFTSKTEAQKHAKNKNNIITIERKTTKNE